MPTGTTNIVTCRWDQVEVGDTIIDYSWREPRWKQVTKIAKPLMAYPDSYREVWFNGGFHDGRGLRVNASSLVDVQVIS